MSLNIFFNNFDFKRVILDLLSYIYGINKMNVSLCKLNLIFSIKIQFKKKMWYWSVVDMYN